MSQKELARELFQFLTGYTTGETQLYDDYDIAYMIDRLVQLIDYKFVDADDLAFLIRARDRELARRRR